jgi:hypothetical protein
VHLNWEILLGGNILNRIIIHFHLGDIFMTKSFLFRWGIILQEVLIIKHYTRLKSSDGIASSKCGYKTGD